METVNDSSELYRKELESIAQPRPKEKVKKK